MTEIKVNLNTHNPELAWQILSNKIKKISCQNLNPNLPIYPDKVCIFSIINGPRIITKLR